MSTAKCIEILTDMMENGGISPSFVKLVKGDIKSWKRISKFNYRDGVRRYFYLLDSALVATVDERDPTSEEVSERNKYIEQLEGITPEETREMLEAKMVKIMVRPPMLWEQYILQDARGNDKFVQDKLFDLWEDYYEFCEIESSKGSEPQQYNFEIGPDDGGWIFFTPIKADHYDSHLSSDLDPILPDWAQNQEVQECTWAIDEHPLWNMGQLDDCLEAIQKELIELGFVHSKVSNYAKCL